jgi:hypothetical protein
MLLPQIPLLIEHAHAVGLIDLALLLRPDRAREMHPIVARDRKADRFLTTGWYVDEDQRIRVITARAAGDGLSVSRMQLGQDAGGQDVAIPVPAAFQSHKEDVLRADRGAAGDSVRTPDAAHVLDE